MNRRRFLTITAGLALAAALPRALRASEGLTQWRGRALGAETTITLAGGDPALLSAIRAEIERLEDIFSLYRPGSELSRLNTEGALEAPSAELRACLALAGRVHAATGGAFDPSIQPLWRAYADAHGAPGQVDHLPLGWGGVDLAEGRIALRPGMALTLNGIAQGYIADRVAALIRARGLDRVMVDTGELHSIGPAPDGQPWPVHFDGGGGLALENRALASSSPAGMTFPDGSSHILDPRTRRPAPSHWSLVSVSSRSAAVADALSTAFCLIDDRNHINRICEQFRDTRVELLRV
ncbi:MAG: FAD:protein FMN transferase [Paracoccus sp. (in: a-proteobacteria)]|nr:FAD:protein FMN transferase [Paracoccus sp. (in: a-proteobacteria)]